MKSKTIAGLIAIIAIVAVAVFAGCIEPASSPPTHSTPSLISSPTPALSPSLASTPTSTPTPIPSPSPSPTPSPTPIPTPSPTPKEMEKIDTDGDGMSDWFEENIANLDQNVPNDRYVLWVSAFDLNGLNGTVSGNREELKKFFVEGYKFLPENVIIIDNATITDFKAAVDELAEKSDENDLVYVYLHGHGAGPHKGLKETVEKIDKEAAIAIVKIELVECFSDVTESRMEFAVNTSEKYWVYNISMTYKEIGETLNKIKCNKMVVGFTSCARDSGVEPLIKDAAYPRVVISTRIALLPRDFQQFRYRYDQIENGYLSIADFFYYHHDRYSEEEIKEALAKISDSMKKGTICYLDTPPVSGCHLWKTEKHGTIFIPNYPGGYFPALGWLKMADPYNISNDFYFGEAKVKDVQT